MFQIIPKEVPNIFLQVKTCSITTLFFCFCWRTKMIRNCLIFVFLIDFSSSLNSCKRNGTKCVPESSRLAGYKLMNTFGDCIGHCRFIRDCNWISYDQNTTICALYDTCQQIESSPNYQFTSNYCIKLRKNEFKTGFCTGKSEDVILTSDHISCLQKCQESDSCVEFTWDTGICALFNKCDGFDDTCSTCITGNLYSVTNPISTFIEKLASEHESLVLNQYPIQEDDVLVIIGHDNSYGFKRANTEIVSLGDNDNNNNNLTKHCSLFESDLPSIPKYAKVLGVSKMIDFGGGQIVKVPIICGVGNSQLDCARYEPIFSKYYWKRYPNIYTYKRDDGTATYVPNKGFLIIGDYGAKGTTKILNLDTMEANLGPVSPKELKDICTVYWK